MMIAIMKVRGVTTFYTSDNESNDGNDDASDDETDGEIGEMVRLEVRLMWR